MNMPLLTDLPGILCLLSFPFRICLKFCTLVFKRKRKWIGVKLLVLQLYSSSMLEKLHMLTDSWTTF